MKQLLTLVVGLMLTTFLWAQSIPAPKTYLGYEPGERFAQHHELVGYLQALAAAAPTQMKLEKYGTTNENRPLVVTYISSPENMAKLEEIRKSNLANAGMGGTPMANQPAVVWLSYSVHGNEGSSVQAVLLTAYHLLTNPQAQQWLKNMVVVIDPCLNPDGYSRYVNWYHGVVGHTMNPEPQSREHREPWPGGRSNHYNFDLNRDWAWQTQLETQQRTKLYHKWMPQVHVDYHEQGYNEPYYFAPAARPYHEVVTDWQRRFQTEVGKNNARYFDKNGWLYFTKQRFDLFYPSYGDTWPTYNGSIGMTYEQGGIGAGLGIINEDGDTLTLAARTIHHFTTGISTLEVAAQSYTDLVKNFKAFFDNVVNNGSGEYKTYVVKARGNANLKHLKLLLDKNGITYTYSEGGTATGFSYQTGKTDKFTLDRGDLLVSTHQPKGVLARVLFEPYPKLEDSATYDITAWALPYAYGLQAFAVKEKLSGTPALAVAAAPAAVLNENAYGYLARWTNMDDARFLAACLQAGIKPRVSGSAFETGGKQYDAGTLIFLKTSNERLADYPKKLFALAAQHQVTLEEVATGMVDKGADFGSSDIASLRKVKIAMLTGEGASSLSAGNIWHYFERDLGYPITLINARDAGGVNWTKFDVVVLPDGNFGNQLGKEGALRKWVEQGGLLIGFEGIADLLASNDWGLKEKKPAENKPGTYDKVRVFANQERESLMEYNPGSIYRLELDVTHPLAFGYGPNYFTLKSDTRVYEFTERGWNVGVMKKEAQVAGFTGSKALENMKDGVIFGQLSAGRGSVVFFTDDILFRNFWQNGKLLMANAALLLGQGGGGYR
ncbi:MAG: M14 family metallopeptidase [Chitinophagaceae bacterium]|nr:M14 family metallopeptidase [Chitinophagaceae bacterium]